MRVDNFHDNLRSTAYLAGRKFLDGVRLVGAGVVRDFNDIQSDMGAAEIFRDTRIGISVVAFNLYLPSSDKV